MATLIFGKMARASGRSARQSPAPLGGSRVLLPCPVVRRPLSRSRVVSQSFSPCPKSDSSCPDTAWAGIRVWPEATARKQTWILRVSWAATSSYVNFPRDGGSLSLLRGRRRHDQNCLKIFLALSGQMMVKMSIEFESSNCIADLRIERGADWRA